VAVAVDYASGDDNIADGKAKHYDNLYYTGHKFRGYMDYFVESSMYGLADLMVHGSLSPLEGWTVRGDLHYFTRATEYVDYRGEETKDLGVELDLTVTTSRVAGVSLTGGGSVFLPSESFAQTEDPEPGLWGYVMATVDFE